MSQTGAPSYHHLHDAHQAPHPPASSFPDVSTLGSSFGGLDQERETLWRAIYALGRNVDSFVGRQETEAQANRRALDAIAQRVAEGGSSMSRGSGVPKFREPRMFNGHTDQLEGFMREVENAIFLQRNTLVSDRERVVYFSFYLGDGAPCSWYRTVELRNPQTGLLDNYPAFITAFRKHFDTPDHYSDALRKLEELTQTETASTFTARFEEIVARLDWTDQTKIQEYWNRLKDNVQDALINRRGRYFTEDFDEFARECISIDNELTQLQLNRLRRPTSMSTQSYDHSPASPSPLHSTIPLPSPSSYGTTAPDVVPMEVDAMKCASLSSEERERRRQMGLCFSCGKGKHLAVHCPNRAP